MMSAHTPDASSGPKPRVAVLDDWQQIAQRYADWSALRERAEVVFFHQPFASAQEVVSALADFDIILAMRERTAFPDEVVERLPRLKFFNMTGRRAKNLEAIVRRGIPVSITGGGEDGADPAEHALALMLSAVRRIPENDYAVKHGAFQEAVEPGFKLAGKTLGILGYGLIGKRIAGYGRALGMNVIIWDYMTPPGSPLDGVEAVELDAVFERADIITVHLVLVPDNKGIVSRERLARMRGGAILVNTSRGPLVDEAALVEALRERRIQAALDVFVEEPLPRDHPLRSAPNLVLTPHVGYGTRDMYEIFYQRSVENTLAFLDGAPIRQYACEPRKE
jgi:D-3-phosphoglycerate dehydrogenase